MKKLTYLDKKQLKSEEREATSSGESSEINRNGLVVTDDPHDFDVYDHNQNLYDPEVNILTCV